MLSCRNQTVTIKYSYARMRNLFRPRRRGVVLLIVLATILMVSILAGAIIGIMSSQSRLTIHQVGRIQARYAAMGAINYAYEQLRVGNWVAGTDCPPNTPCPVPYAAGDFFPRTIQGNAQVTIATNCPPTFTNPTSNCINATVIYHTN